MKNKKGFTLIELIAVITLLALIVLVTVPVIINTLSNSEQKEYEDFEKLVINATELYVEQNRELFPALNQVSGSVTIDANTLISEGYLRRNLKNPTDNVGVYNYKIIVEVSPTKTFIYKVERK